MGEKVKRPVARRTLYLAIEQTIKDNSDADGTGWMLSTDSTIGELLECIKDSWFQAVK